MIPEEMQLEIGSMMIQGDAQSETQLIMNPGEVQLETQSTVTPEEVLGTVWLIKDQICDHKIIMNPSYHQSIPVKEDEAFYFFVTRILVAMKLASSHFRQSGRNN